eukprot:1155212-Pelagomonas_calceolata.AAC.7
MLGCYAMLSCTSSIGVQPHDRLTQALKRLCCCVHSVRGKPCHVELHIPALESSHTTDSLKPWCACVVAESRGKHVKQ